MWEGSLGSGSGGEGWGEEERDEEMRGEMCVRGTDRGGAREGGRAGDGVTAEKRLLRSWEGAGLGSQPCHSRSAVAPLVGRSVWVRWRLPEWGARCGCGWPSAGKGVPVPREGCA